VLNLEFVNLELQTSLLFINVAPFSEVFHPDQTSKQFVFLWLQVLSLTALFLFQYKDCINILVKGNTITSKMPVLKLGSNKKSAQKIQYQVKIACYGVFILLRAFPVFIDSPFSYFITQYAFGFSHLCLPDGVQ
jgi:hypothetical protein